MLAAIGMTDIPRDERFEERARQRDQRRRGRRAFIVNRAVYWKQGGGDDRRCADRWILWRALRAEIAAVGRANVCDRGGHYDDDLHFLERRIGSRRFDVPRKSQLPEVRPLPNAIPE